MSSKTTFVKTPVFLSDGQLGRIGKKSSETVKLRISLSKKPNHHLFLTKTQVDRIQKGKTQNKSYIEITLSKHLMQKNGGFIITVPLLLSGIAAAAAVAGAASGVAKTVNDGKHNHKMETETKRHNNEIENLLKSTQNLKLGSGGGKGVFLPKRR